MGKHISRLYSIMIVRLELADIPEGEDSMRIVNIVLVALVVIMAVVFAAQNSVQTTVVLLGWSVNGQLSIMLIIALVIGFALGLLIMVPSVLRHRKTASGLKKKVSAMEKEGGSGPADPPQASGS